MAMQIRKASRKNVKIKMGLSAVSGGGKTYSSLLIAKGLCGDWGKICVIDTENNSAELYSHLGDYNVLPITNYSPKTYIEAIKTCEEAGMEVIIIDSISHEWDWCLAYHAQLGGTYQDWSKVTPLDTAFRNKILQSSCHVITTVRRKQDFDMTRDGNGKLKIEKAGLKEQTRDGWEYEITLNLELNESNYTKSSKDRTGLFKDVEDFKITEETGKTILNWCLSSNNIEEVLQAAIVDINNSTNLEGLVIIFNTYIDLQKNEEFLKVLKLKKESLTIK